MKKETAINDFGKRLAYYRKSKGLTQGELGEKVGVTYRVIAYYEKETKYPPARLIVPLAKTLGITTDELLGATETKKDFDTRNTALWRKLKVVEDLPPKDKKAILHYIATIAKSKELNQKAK